MHQIDPRRGKGEKAKEKKIITNVNSSEVKKIKMVARPAFDAY